MRSIGLIAAIVALGGLTIAVRLPHHKQTFTYQCLLFVCLLILPGIVLLSTFSTATEDMKQLSSCATCHIMQPFVNDLLTPASRTLAARHYQNQWIADQPCYTCHTTYGLQGTLVAKYTAIRHWVLYVTGKWTEPITHHGPYPNANCLRCHGNTTTFLHVGSHQARLEDLRDNRARCVTCHGAPHPAPEDRHAQR